MTNMFCESAFFGVVISLLAYELGMLLKKKFGFPIFNPLLISIAVVIVFLAVFDIDYQNYNDGAKYLSYLLTPATVCLAIPLYEQFVAELMDHDLHVETGWFGADMEVSLINDGPVTLILDTEEMRTGRVDR